MTGSGMDKDVRFIRPGQIWDAASGERFGVRIVSKIKSNGDVTVADLKTGERREIDWFKLTYRYKPRSRK